MAPSPASGAQGWDRVGRENDDGWETRVDRKVLAGAVGMRACGGLARRWGLVTCFPQARKPLVEKKRRARINESLQELRLLLAGTEVRRAGRWPGTAEQAGGGRGTAHPHCLFPPGVPAAAGAGQAGERRGAGADRAARAGRVAGPGAW